MSGSRRSSLDPSLLRNLDFQRSTLIKILEPPVHRISQSFSSFRAEMFTWFHDPASTITIFIYTLYSSNHISASVVFYGENITKDFAQ